MFHCLTEDGHVRPKIFNNQPFRETALDKLEKREGADTLFVQPILALRKSIEVQSLAKQPSFHKTPSSWKLIQVSGRAPHGLFYYPTD